MAGAAGGRWKCLEAVDRAIQAAQKETQRPSLIAVRTFIGWGSPNKQNKSSAHGEPLGVEEMGLTKANLCWPAEPAFCLPEPAIAFFRQALDRGQKMENEWSSLHVRMKNFSRNKPVN